MLGIAWYWWTLIMAFIILSLTGWFIWLPKVLNWIADFNEWWSPFKALPLEGELRLIARGNKDGPFAALLESVPTHEYNKKEDEFVENKNPNTGKTIIVEPKGYLAKHGLAYTGFNRYVAVRKFKYTKFEKLDNSSNFGLVEKVRTGPSIYFIFNIAARLEKAETRGNFPVSVTVNMTVELTKPRRALFLTGGWEDQVVAAVLSVIRHYVSTKNVEDLRTEKENGQTSGLATAISAKGGALNQTLLDKFGITIIDAVFIDFDDTSADKADSDAIKAKERARLQGEAQVEAAKAEKEAATHRAEAIKIEYAARIGTGGQHAGTFRMAEALEKTPLKALGGNNLIDISK